MVVDFKLFAGTWQSLGFSLVGLLLLVSAKAMRAWPVWRPLLPRRCHHAYPTLIVPRVHAGVKNQPIASNPLPAGLLYVGEQMPGYWVYEDRTPWLTPAASASAAPEHSRPAADRSLQAGPLVPINGAVVGPGQGYYASFNRPSFPLIYNVSNQWTLYQT